MTNVRAIGVSGVTPEVILGEVAAQNPKQVLVAFIDQEGNPSVLYTPMSPGDLLYLHKVIDISIDRRMQGEGTATDLKV